MHAEVALGDSKLMIGKLREGVEQTKSTFTTIAMTRMRSLGKPL